MSTETGTVTDLGFAAGATVAVVHADDMGMCHSANVGAFEALTNGPATCGSVMVPCPWFAEAAATARAEPDFDLGVHLTLNAEYEGYRWGPITDAPSLVGTDGNLHADPRDTVRHGDPDEVHVELRAQIERALDAGIDVTHIDSHCGTVFHAKFFDIYLDLAREFTVPAFLPTSAPPADSPENPPSLDPVLAIGHDGWPLFDGFCADSLDFAPGHGADHNRRRIAGLGPGLNYLICHPAAAGTELDAIIPRNAHARDFERAFYGGDEGRRVLAEAGVETIGMRPLRDLLHRRRAQEST